jgi:hypothetical protein
MKRIFVKLVCVFSLFQLSEACLRFGSHNTTFLRWIHERTISLRVLGKIFRVLKLAVFLNIVYITNQFQTTFAQGRRGGVKSISRGDCDWQGGKLLRLLSQLRLRIQPLFSYGECWRDFVIGECSWIVHHVQLMRMDLRNVPYTEFYLFLSSWFLII